MPDTQYMSKNAKLLAKLRNGSINAKEARTLLKQMGWVEKPGNGSSHEQWVGPNSEKLTLATHNKYLKRYQIKELNEKIKDEK